MLNIILAVFAMCAVLVLLSDRRAQACLCAEIFRIGIRGSGSVDFT